MHWYLISTVVVPTILNGAKQSDFLKKKSSWRFWRSGILKKNCHDDSDKAIC